MKINSGEVRMPFLLIFGFTFCWTIMNGKAQDFTWIEQSGYFKNRGDFSQVCADGNGNVIQIFQGDDRKIVTGNDTLASYSLKSAVVVKYDSDGNYLWAHVISGADDKSVYPTGVAVDSSGNIYVCGRTYSEKLHFTPDDSVILSNIRSTSGFLAKYSPDGHLHWSRMIPANIDSSSVSLECLLVDNNGAIVTGGYFNWKANLGDTTLIGGYANLLLIKYTPDGARKWVRTGSGASSFNRFVGLSCDAENNIYAIGKKGWAILFSEYQIPVDDAGENLLLCKFDAEGVLKWHFSKRGDITVSSVSGNRGNIGLGVAADASGNVYFTGALVDSTPVNAGTGKYDYYTKIYMARLYPDGTLAWEQKLGNGIEIQGRGVAVDSCSYPYFTGYYRGNITIGGTVLPYTDTIQSFIAKLDTTGTPLWIQSSSGDATYAHDVYADVHTGSIISSGAYQSKLRWPPVQIDFESPIPESYRNYYVAKQNNHVICPPPYEPSVIPGHSHSNFELKVYPVPTTNVLIIETAENDIHFSLVDITGRISYAGHSTGKRTIIDVGRMPAGVYSIRAKGKEGHEWIRKVVISK